MVTEVVNWSGSVVKLFVVEGVMVMFRHPAVINVDLEEPLNQLYDGYLIQERIRCDFNLYSCWFVEYSRKGTNEIALIICDSMQSMLNYDRNYLTK